MKTTHCDPNNATAFLDGTMLQNREADYMRHLDSCHICQTQLERSAADEKQWSDAQTLLAGSQRYSGQTVCKNPLAAEPSSSVRQVLGSLLPTDDPNSLGRIDNYEITGVVGSGAMGIVLKAHDSSLDRIVAVKVMSPTLAVSGAARARFTREAKAAAAVLHPNIIAVHGVRTTGELPYLVMPYLKGVSVEQRVSEQGPLGVAEILRIGSQIASGLDAAHQQGVIHRDIKPANVMLDSGIETAVITDFGLARTLDDATMTRTGVITGTPEYMSPEQARGEYIDSKSDMFSLGSLLYMLCTGHAPFRAQTPFGVLRRISDDQPRAIRSVNSEIPQWLCQIIGLLQSKDPTERPSAKATHQILESCLAHVHQPDQFDLPPICRRQQPTSKSRLSVSLGIGGITMLIAVAIAAIFVFPPSIQEAGTTTETGREAHGLMTTTVPSPKDSSRKIFKSHELEFPNAERVRNVEIDINRGFIEVVTHDKPTVVINILSPKKASHSHKRSTLNPQFAPTYDLDIDKEKNLISLDTYNQSYALNLLVKVPKQTNLVLDTYYDGYLKVRGVEGTIVAESQNCDIALENISGSARASSYNGDFVVSFRHVADDADLDFESYNGSVDLTLPGDAKVTTAVRSGRGSYGSEFEIGPFISKATRASRIDNISEYSLGSINGGGIPLRIESEKGAIAIRKSSGK
ncbi:MAG: hypothetical protein Aurels2KO_40680 [Aureliella sp.]